MDHESHFISIARSKFAVAEGSRLLVGKCSRCGQPMRVTREEAAKSLYVDRILCRDCSPVTPPDKGEILTYRQATVLGKTRS